MLAGFSKEMTAREADLKAFMYKRLYYHPLQIEVAGLARQIVAGLFNLYANEPDTLPLDWLASLPGEQPDRARHIADFIAGMTDRYAITCYRNLVEDIELPEGF